MDLYFLRHGIAADRGQWEGDDATRPLTPEGRSRVRRAAKVLDRLRLKLDLILTSPLARARETAVIVAERLRVQDRLREEPRLGPGFNGNRLHAILQDNEPASRLLLVGHEPDFSQTVSEIIGGGNLIMKKGSLARVRLASLPSLKGELLWLIPPKLLRLD